ncbi:hypothetical protein Tco_0781316 [Tanacetum coccineum]
MITDAIQQECENLRAEITSQINNAITNHIPSHVDSSVRNYMSGHILHVHPTQASQAYAQEQQYQLYLTMKDNPQLQHDDLPIWLALKIKFEGLYAFNTPCRTFAIHPRDQDDPHDDAHPEGENSEKRQKTLEHGTYVFRESSSGQVNESEPGPSTSGNQEQLDDFDFWTDTYATDDDELSTEKVSQELVEEMSQIIDETKLRKVVNEILRQRCTSRDEHQYHIDQMQNFLKNDIVEPKAPALSLVNQDLLYLKKGNSGPEKFVLSLHKFPAVIFPDDDIEERTSKWVDKCMKKFNPYARYSVEHWKNPQANIFYIKRQKEPGNPKEDVYSNSKIIEVIKHMVQDYAETRLVSPLSSSSEVHLNKEDAEYLQLFEEGIEERLKHRDQMRHWEIYCSKTCDPTGTPLSTFIEQDAPAASTSSTLKETQSLVHTCLIEFVKFDKVSNSTACDVSALRLDLRCLEEAVIYHGQVISEEDTYDDLFDYLQQFEKLVNTSRAKKLEKSHDPLTRSYVQEEIIKGNNVHNDAGKTQSSSNYVFRICCKCLMLQLQRERNIDSDAGLSYDSTFLSEMSENEVKYHDTVLDLEAKAKENENVVLKVDRSLQGMFMLGPKPMSFYDPNLKHGLGYENPYTLKKAISQNLKLYDASCFDDTNIHVNIRDTEDILDD